MRKIAALVLFVCFTSFQPAPKTWLALGDSITYLNDHLDETGKQVTKGYLSRVVEMLPQHEYINKGYNGWTAQRIAQQIDHLGLTRAEVYTVFLGTNDWWAGVPLGTLDDYQKNKGTETIYGSFRIIVDKLRALNPDAPIILLTPMQRADFVYINDPHNHAYGSYKTKADQSLESIAEAVMAIGKYEHLPVVDLYHLPALKLKKLVHFKRLKDPQTGEYHEYTYPAYTDIPFDPATDDYPYPPAAIDMTYDGLHPSDQGNAVIAKKLARVMKKAE
ncbi:Lysophospholipase L1 [Catalinimonas alkaloidigena]|uniref:Lysophospholipase L1 n=1 Tax=Catalinimonas alkaloidigena TaxID=1075417 RepID=A0A1G9K017_9BACT|nr:SGNH/GDSL hydrolase family protein [Catalinimonas alkaloidigena]SDL43119.1 Lysophospholipase L1 [Catalinimonas alkaloidigena]